MNNQVAKVEDAAASGELVQTSESESSFQLLMNPTNFKTIQTIAEQIAKSTAGKKLNGNVGDCFAIALDALSAGLNPFKVAQEAHITQGGQVGYSAKVVNAVIIARAPIRKRPEYEYFGDWSKILGKIEERKSDGGGKYYVATWKEADEEGLGVIVTIHVKGEEKPRTMELLLKQCWPRFSTQWAMDPKQQISYASVRKFARRDFPDVIMGMYTVEEMEGDEGLAPAPRHMGQADVVTGAADDKAKGLSAADLAAWRAAAAKGVDAASRHWAGIGKEKRGLATEEQKLEIRAIADKADKERTLDADGGKGETKTASSETNQPASETPAAASETGADQPAQTAASGASTDDFVAAMDRADAQAAAAKGGKASK